MFGYRWHKPQTALRSSALGLLSFLLTGVCATGWAQEDAHDDGDRVHHVPLFPTLGNDAGRQGFVRIFNHEDDPGEVHIQAVDDSGYKPGEITLMMDGKETVHFNSRDLEDGGDAAEGKGLAGSTGAPMQGDWRLEMTSNLDIEVLAYIRHEDGFLTSMTDTTPYAGRRNRAAVFNPGSNKNQVSHLRLINAGHDEAEVEIVGIDDAGMSPGETVEVTVGEGRSVTLSAADLEDGSTEFEGKLGDGQGKWQLNITATEPIMVMSLMESTMTMQLTNLSTAPMTEFETAMQVFAQVISEPIVDAKCINCHVAGGASGSTPLVFEPKSADSEDGDAHATHNFDQFKDYLAAGAHDDHDHDDERPAGVILNKIQGNLTHGGGEQVPAGSEEFQNMERFLSILEDEVAADPGDHGGEDDHGDG